MDDPLAAVLTEALVASLAGSRSFERGVAYVEERAVGRLRASAGRVTASVHGTDRYEVELAAEDGERLRFACSCPVGVEGAFCKHCVAVALTWMGEHEELGPTLDDARVFLGTLAPQALVEILIEHAHEDDNLARKLLLMTARPVAGSPFDLRSVRGMVGQAFAVHGFISWREMYGYARGIDEAIDVLERLLDEGHADALVELSEYALGEAERALDHVDDSGGAMRSILDRLEALHHEACLRGGPDVHALAERLFEHELAGTWDVLGCAVMRYQDVLGEAGVEHYRSLAEARWKAVPALRPGDDTRDNNGKRFQITRIMETLAELSGDLAAQIAVRERDLSSGYRFLEIAELCRRHGEDDAALTWAERGLSAFRAAPDPRLRSFTIEEYRRRGRAADALEQSWLAFEARPTLESYRQVATDAQAVGRLAEHRAAAIVVLKRQEPASARRHPSLRGRGWSELVRVLLWEGDVDAAWGAAEEGGCTRDLWLALAERRRETHPSDALTVYRRHVEDIIGRKDNNAYQQAVEVIDGPVRALFTECGRSDDFAGYVAEVRRAHKPKRNLLKLMASLP